MQHETLDCHSNQDEIEVEIDLKDGNHILKGSHKCSKKKHRRRCPLNNEGFKTPNIDQKEK